MKTESEFKAEAEAIREEAAKLQARVDALWEHAEDKANNADRVNSAGACLRRSSRYLGSIIGELGDFIETRAKYEK